MSTVKDWFAERDGTLNDSDRRFIQERRGDDLAQAYASLHASGLTPVQELARERLHQLEESWDAYWELRTQVEEIRHSDSVPDHEYERVIDDLVNLARLQGRLMERKEEWTAVKVHTG